MSGEVSCRAIRPLFRYLNEHNLSLAELLADFPLSSDVLLAVDNWIPEALFAQLLDQAVSLSGDSDLIAHIGKAAGELCPFGPLSPQAALVGSPEALFEQANDFLGLLQQEGRVLVRNCGPNRAVIECFPPPGGHRSYYVCAYTRHMLAAIPLLWRAGPVHVRESRCAVPLAQVRFPQGMRYAVDADGNVWEISGQEGSAARSHLGELSSDGSFMLNGTLYGADRCTYEVTWSVPSSTGLHRIFSWFGSWTAVRWPLLNEVQRQQAVIQSLRNDLRHQNQRIEAKVLERTDGLRTKARQMALIEQAGRRFASILDPEAMAREATRTLREEFGYFTAVLYLVDDGGWVLRSLNTGDETVRLPVHPGNVPYSTLEKLRRTARPLSHDDLSRSPHPLGLPQLGRGRASLTAPLIASDRLLGVIDLQSPLAGHFDNDDALALHTLATQVATTLERSYLYREEQRARQRADAMAVLARVITTSLELDRVLALALDQLERFLPYDAAAILLLEGGQRVIAASKGVPATAEQSLAQLFDADSGGVLARTLQVGTSLLVQRSSAPRDAFPSALSAFSGWLSVPLSSRGSVIGAILVAYHQEEDGSTEALRSAEDFSGQVATAIENARLYEQVRRDRDRMDSLYRIAGELNSDMEIHQVLEHILNLAQASVGATAGSIILLDDAARPTHSIILRSSGATPGLLQDVLTRGAAGWVVREQRGLLVRDTDHEPRWLTFENDPWRTRSAIVVPLVGQNRVIGVLTVVHRQPGRFDQDDLELLSSIAEQASSVVQRANLFAAIRSERARLEAVVEGTADPVIILDEAGRILRLNRSAARIFDLDPQAVTAQMLARVLQHPAVQHLLGAAGSGESKRAELPLPDGRTFYATLTPIVAVGAVITMQDITHLKQIDRMKSDFVANVSHDLRTPLGNVRGYAEMLDVAGPLNEDQSRFVRRILFSVDSMVELVANLLDLARIEAGVEMEMAPCQMAAVIAESLDQVGGSAAEKALSIQVAIPDELPLVWGNGWRLGQVMNNLLSNAIKYTPTGGHLVVQAAKEEEELVIAVADDGPGIPAEDLPHLFEKFYRAKKTGQGVRGTGLGLSIAYSIVQAHGGRIWVDSVEGQGTAFRFSLPLWQGTDLGPPRLSAPGARITD